MINEAANPHILNVNQANEAEKAGALKRDTHVKARMKDDTWCIAKILESRIVNDGSI